MEFGWMPGSHELSGRTLCERLSQLSPQCEGAWVLNHLTYTGGKKEPWWKVNRKVSVLHLGSQYSLETPGHESCLQRSAREALILSVHSDRKTLAYISGQKKEKQGEKEFIRLHLQPPTPPKYHP